MAKSSMVIKDKKWQAVLSALPHIKGASVDIGVQSDAGESEGVSIAQYAFYNEFGRNVRSAAGDYFQLPRPAIRNAADEKGKRWESTAYKLLGAVMVGERELKASLSIVGEMAQADIQASITSLRNPPNAQSTIDAKGSSNPLIDSGAYRGSIRYKVNL